MKKIIFGLLVLGFSSSAFAKNATVICRAGNDNKVIKNCRVKAGSQSLMCINNGFIADETEYISLRSVGANRFDIEKTTVFFGNDLLKKQVVDFPTARGVLCKVSFK